MEIPNTEKFNTDAIFELLPEDDKKSFIVWDNIYCSMGGNIIAVYRAPFVERVYILMCDYKLKELELSRDSKINDLLN